MKVEELQKVPSGWQAIWHWAEPWLQLESAFKFRGNLGKVSGTTFSFLPRCMTHCSWAWCNDLWGLLTPPAPPDKWSQASQGSGLALKWILPLIHKVMRSCSLSFTTAACCKQTAWPTVSSWAESLLLFLWDIAIHSVSLVLEVLKKKNGRNKHQGKIPLVRSMDFSFTSVLKVSCHFYTICFDFLLFFIIIKLQPEPREKKPQLSSRAFLGFFFHLKLPQYLELLRWGKIALLFSQKACFKESAFSHEKSFVEITQPVLLLSALSIVLLYFPSLWRVQTPPLRLHGSCAVLDISWAISYTGFGAGWWEQTLILGFPFYRILQM